YFIGIAIIGIYLSMILIGRRHWLGGKDGTSMLWHYLVRAVCLAAVVISGVLVAQYSPLNKIRMDISQKQVSTVSDETIDVLTRLSEESDEPEIKINAFVSNNMPTEYVQTKYDLVNLLREFDVLGGSRVNVNLFQGIEPFSKDAIDAEKKFGIRPRKIASESRGAQKLEDVILGVAFQCGLERVVIPFFPYGMPVEYELMRSINTVAQAQRKTIGIVNTDLFIVGGSIRTQEGTLPIPTLKIIGELSKQYNLEIVAADSPIPVWTEEEETESDSESETAKSSSPQQRRYDVLLVAQPSSMSPNEIKNLIAAIQTGQPVIIFEDPFPNPENFRHMSGRGTLWPRAIGRGGTGTGKIQDLWNALDLDVDTGIAINPATRSRTPSPYLVWQLSSENPYTRDPVLNLPERLVIQETRPDLDPMFSKKHPSTKGIKELCFQYAGHLRALPNTALEHEYLIKTGNAGRLLALDFWTEMARFGMYNPRAEEALMNRRGSANNDYFIGAHVAGVDAEKALNEKVEPSKSNTNVIYICDCDILSDYFVDIRNNPIQRGISYEFQNMAFVLNLFDSMVGEETYLNLRSRQIRHMTLRVVEETTEKAMQIVYDQTQQLEKDRMTAEAAITAKINEEINPLKTEIQSLEDKRDKGEPIDVLALKSKKQLLENIQLQQQQRLLRKQEELNNNRKEQLRLIQLDAENEIQQIQKKFKLYAVFIPPIPPLLVGLIVFTRRRLREREGISKARRLK
ncbi:MAG: Gldg family protein, partial [Planctomycetota bacterium]